MEHDDSTTMEGLPAAQGIDLGQPSKRLALVFYHREGTRAVELLEGTVLSVGRSLPCDVVMDDPSLSRMHARFRLVDGRLTLEDLRSTNGTVVGGQRIERATVQANDEILLGNVRAVVTAVASPQLVAVGVDSYDRFLLRLGEELVRARTFGRSAALLLVRGMRRRSHHIRGLCQEVRPALRPVDYAGAYDEHTLMVMAPELGGPEAAAHAQHIRQHAGAELRVGIALYPSTASSTEELVSQASHACRRACDAQPVVVAQRSEDSAVPSEQALFMGPAMRRAEQLALRVAKRGVPVVVRGETGVGKEVMVGLIHRSSGRAGPLKVINCAAIPKELTEGVLFGHERGAFTGAERRRAGLFEQAQGGTLFLDEVGELPLQAQAALLRVLQEKRVTRVGGAEEISVDVRVVAATHRDLEAMVEGGSFRQDLYYRLNAVVIDVPPLRERVEEIEGLARLFQREVRAEWGEGPRELSAQALSHLRAYRWPCNIRELRNVVERGMARCDSDVLGPDELPAPVREGLAARGVDSGAGAEPVPTGAADPPASEADGSGSLRDRVRHYERDLIRDTLRQTEGNVSRAAQRLDIPIRTLSRKVRELGLKSGDDDG